MSDTRSSESALPVDWTTAQPYEQWRAVRESACPVVETGATFGSSTGYQVTDYEHVESVLRDPETFSSSINGEHIGQFMGDLILALDGIEHRKYRNLVAKAFRASQLERWDDALVRPAIARLLDVIAPAGRGDLVADVTTKYPVQVICGIVGVPLEDSDQFAQWAEQINTGPMNPPVGHAASQAMVDYLRPLVEARRAEPTGDFLSDLVNSEIDGEKLTDSKIYGFLRLLLPAGAETTFRVMGNCLVALLSHPGVYEQVVADRTLMPEVIEETLRWETSVTMVSRVSAKDTEIAGCPVRAGSPISVLTGSANHDAPLRRSRRVAPRSSGAASRRVRHRPAPVPRDAPRPARAARRPRHDSRPAAQSPARPRSTTPGDRGIRVPWARPAAGAVRPCLSRSLPALHFTRCPPIKRAVVRVEPGRERDARQKRLGTGAVAACPVSRGLGGRRRESPVDVSTRRGQGEVVTPREVAVDGRGFGARQRDPVADRSHRAWPPAAPAGRRNLTRRLTRRSFALVSSLAGGRCGAVAGARQRSARATP